MKKDAKKAGREPSMPSMKDQIAASGETEVDGVRAALPG